MLSTIHFCVKFLLLSIFILVLGNWVRWDGRTISDQVKVGMSHAEESQIYNDIRSWATRVTNDARKGVQNKVNSNLKLKTEADSSNDVPEKEDISSTERQKLKALIRELNSSQKVD